MKVLGFVISEKLKQMNKIVITTVGTSLIERKENQIKGKRPNGSFSKWKNYTNEDEDGEIDILKQGLDELLLAKKNDKNICAEVKSCLKIQETYSDLEVYLICTDTILSPLCAEYIKQILDAKGITTHFKYDRCFIIDGLIVDGQNAAKQFEEEGFMNLIHRINSLDAQRKKPIDDLLKQELKDLRSITDLKISRQKSFEVKERAKKNEQQSRIILNISGGYKALVPVMTIMGQLYNMEINYIYEDSEDLIKIGSMPIHFDWSLGEFYLEYMTNEGLKVINQTPEILSELRLMGLVQKAAYKRTILGNLFKDYIENLSNAKNGTTGYLVELKVYQYFVENHRIEFVKVTQGKAYWWSKLDESNYQDTSQFEEDEIKERKIDIDMFLTKNNGQEIWCEVKSYSERGLAKAEKQVKVFLDFIEATSYNKAVKKVEEIRLLLYKLPKVSKNKYDKKLTSILDLCKSRSMECSIYLMELPSNSEGLPNLKAFFDQDLEIVQYLTTKV